MSAHRGRPPRPRPAAEELAAVVEKLGALVGAGVAPTRAWSHVAEGSRDPVLVEVVRRIGAGAAPADAILGALAGSLAAREGRGPVSPRLRDAWAVLAAAWFVAGEAGAPLRGCLGEIAESLSTVGAVERQTAAALAGPAASARLVLALPIVALVGGSLLGLDTVRILFGTPLGAGCLVLGLALMLTGHVWSRHLLHRARSLDVSPGLALDLVALATTGGVAPSTATALVHDALARSGLSQGGRLGQSSARDPRTSRSRTTVGGMIDASPSGAIRETAHVTVPGAPAEAAIGAVLALAERAGAPPADLLRREAARVRRDAVSDALRRASALEVWLMLPLGLCVLPAFILLAIAPVLIGLLSSSVIP